MKNSELYLIFNHYKLLGDLSGASIKYAVIKNERLILEELKVLEEIRKPSEKYQEFLKKQADIQEKYKKDGKVEFTKEEAEAAEINNASMKQEITSLKEDNKDEIAVQEIKQKDFSEMLDRDSTIKLHKISISCVPEEVSTNQMSILSYFISDDEKQK